MIESQYQYTKTDQKTIEKIVRNEHAMINHMVLPKGDALPEHRAHPNIFMIIIRGQITLQLENQDAHTYPAGSILTIPDNTLMNVSNQNDLVLEFFVVKAPAP